MSQSNSNSYKLTTEQQTDLEAVLRAGNYKPCQVPHTRIAVQGPDCRINLYNSGKLLIQGKGGADFIMFVLEPEVLKDAAFIDEKVVEAEAFTPHMGVDESGKGDFFGPLVVSAAYLDDALVKPMQDLGVRDSKAITSDKKALAMGSAIKKILGHRYSVVAIGPKKYNELYARSRNLNRLLAWAHATAIEDLLKAVPECPRALSDKFGHSSLIERELKRRERGQHIELEQKTKAESDLAVAAASIIARSEFLTRLKALGDRFDVELAKGASSKVLDVGQSLVDKEGPKVLLETAKCHFKTTDKVLARLGKDRMELGPDGAATSRAYER